MKIFYIANMRLPSERAHSIQIMKTCEALSLNGADVELLVPNRETDIQEDVFKYYSAKRVFKIWKVFALDIVSIGWLGFWIETITFTETVVWRIVFKRGIFYTRDEYIAFCLRLLGKRVVWEAHMGQKNLFVKFLILFRTPVVVISNGLKNLYVSMGVPEEKILVAPDGVDLNEFNTQISKVDARAKLGISSRGKVVMYVGSRQGWKGVEILEEAAKYLPSDIRVMIISGKPYKEIPLYLRAADLLVIPNSGTEDISRLYTSPMKLFEYIASGTPIVASDLPSIREILPESEVSYFTPNDAKSLAEVIMKSLVSERSIYNIVDINEYSWLSRAGKIMKFISLNFLKE